MKKYNKLIAFIAISVTLCCLLYSFTTKRDIANNSGWVQLFNGKNLDNWTVKIHHYEVEDNFGNTFRVEDGILKVRYDEYEGDFNDSGYPHNINSNLFLYKFFSFKIALNPSL